MVIRLPLAALLGAVGMFLFGFFWFGFLMQRVEILRPMPEELANDFKHLLPRDGVYLYPYCNVTGDAEKDEKAKEEWKTKVAAGPFVMATLKVTGSEPMDPKAMALGFAHNYVSALLAGFLLWMAMNSLCCYPVRVLFVTLLGGFSALWCNGADLVWWHRPADVTLFFAAYNAGAWFVAGIVMSLIIRPKSAV